MRSDDAPAWFDPVSVANLCPCQRLEAKHDTIFLGYRAANLVRVVDVVSAHKLLVIWTLALSWRCQLLEKCTHLFDVTNVSISDFHRCLSDGLNRLGCNCIARRLIFVHRTKIIQFGPRANFSSLPKTHRLPDTWRHELAVPHDLLAAHNRAHRPAGHSNAIVGRPTCPGRNPIVGDGLFAF